MVPDSMETIRSVLPHLMHEVHVALDISVIVEAGQAVYPPVIHRSGWNLSVTSQ